MTKLFKGLLTGASLLALAPAVQAADQLSYAGGWPRDRVRPGRLRITPKPWAKPAAAS
ncbi:hypothetical protein [Phaeobacter sp. 22II1-1F12B]|uniref:hypothetical protein n=1 Tax=Phaeobacter sp. 22II1-1F12B TaxID=1317111 RepID=UPI001E557490|nr:hypothetical protein [Phaeobacter sp. 22II1-1F12B]